jgi:hypothetical protein
MTTKMGHRQAPETGQIALFALFTQDIFMFKGSQNLGFRAEVIHIFNAEDFPLDYKGSREWRNWQTH